MTKTDKSHATTALRDAAVRYAELGYRVFPLAPRAKLPKANSAGLLDATSDMDQIERWWAADPHANIGIRTDGLVVIDPDLLDKETDPKPNPWLAAEPDKAASLASAPTQRTWSGGRQHVFRQPSGKTYRNTNGDLAPNVDTRAFGGYVVAPPSIVKNCTRQGRYEWVAGCELDVEPDALPEPPAWLAAELDRIEANRGKPKASNGQSQPVGDAIPKGKRDATLASMAGTMRRKGFDAAAIEAALLRTNEVRCNPPLPEADVKRIAASVARYEPSDPAAPNASPTIEYKRITAAELDDGDYRTEFLIDGTLVAGQPLIVAGGKKCLKTNILLDAAISLATGTPMLGTLTVNRSCRVAMMSGENGLATIQETARRIAGTKNIDGKTVELKDISGLIFSPDLPRIDDARHQVALAEFLTADEIELVIIDPAYLTLPSDDNGNLFAQGNLLRTLTTVCSEVGASLVLCHHTKRTGVDPFQPPELEHIAWAGFQEFARQWWLLGRRERFDPDSDGEHKLWLNIGGSAGFAALWAVDIAEGKYPDPRRWEVTLSHAAEAREQAVEQQQAAKADAKSRKHAAAVEAAKERIADALRSVPDNADTKRGLRERSGLRPGAAFDDAVGYLLRTGKLVPCEIERDNGHKYEGLRYEFGHD